MTALVLCLLAGCKPNNGTAGPDDAYGDPQVLGLALVESDHQAEVATAALQRGLVHPEIAAYAQALAAEQSASRDRLVQISQQQGIGVDQTTVESQQNLKDTADDIMLIQPPVEGAQVDAVYFPDSLHDVSKAIDIYDATLLPNVRNAVLRDELDVIRQQLVDTLTRGQAVAAATGLMEKK